MLFSDERWVVIRHMHARFEVPLYGHGVRVLPSPTLSAPAEWPSPQSLELTRVEGGTYECAHHRREASENTAVRIRYELGASPSRSIP